MCASNVAGHGPYSQVYEFKTAYAHPHPVKGKFMLKITTRRNLRDFIQFFTKIVAAPRVSNITETGCLVEWSPLKHIPGQGDLSYRVSLTKGRDSEPRIVSVFYLVNTVFQN